MPKKRTIAFRPTTESLGGDRLFRDETYTHVGDASHWLEPARSLAQHGANNGFVFHTDDMVDLREADALILGELPMSGHELTELRKRYRRLKLLLQVTETPLGRAWAFDPANHSVFDAVLTYNHRLAGRPGYFLYKLPAGGLTSWERLRPGSSWDERKTASMVAHVPNVTPWFPRRSGLGMLRAGWRFTPRTWWNYVREGGSLYQERFSVSLCLAEMLAGDFDIYGPGWSRIGNAAIRAAYRGPALEAKLELLGRYRFTIAYENCLNDVGYISEKLFDAFLAGTVPVYLGNLKIEELVPTASFVDARKFTSRKELGAFIKGMPKRQWAEMRAAGDAFLRNGADRLFGADQYVQAVLQAVQFVLRDAGV